MKKWKVMTCILAALAFIGLASAQVNSVPVPNILRDCGGVAKCLAILTDGSITVNSEGRKVSYTASATVAAASTPTDIFAINGSATKVIRVTQITVNGSSTNGGNLLVQLAKRSALNTGGTTASASLVAYDSTDTGTPSAAVWRYSANPTALGAQSTLSGFGNFAIRQLQLSQGVLSSAAAVPVEWTFGTRPAKAMVIRGTAQQLGINLAGVTVPTGAILNVTIEWTEE